MTYQPNIPKATELISVSQDDILQNFQAVDAAWNINHDDFNSATQGKHKFVEMPDQGIDPAGIPPGAANEFTLFSQQTATNNNQELWYQRNNEATAYQLTSSNPVKDGFPYYAGYSFLPGGILIQWVRCSDNDTGSRGKNDGAAITFPTAFSSTPYTVQLTAERNGTTTMGLYYTSLTSSGFTLKVNSNSNIAITVLAIGPGPL